MRRNKGKRPNAIQPGTLGCRNHSFSIRARNRRYYRFRS